MESCLDRPRITPLQNQTKWNTFTHPLPLYLSDGLLHRPCEMVKLNTTTPSFVCKQPDRNLSRLEVNNERKKFHTNEIRTLQRYESESEREQHPIMKCYAATKRNYTKRFLLDNFQPRNDVLQLSTKLICYSLSCIMRPEKMLEINTLQTGNTASDLKLP